MADVKTDGLGPVLIALRSLNTDFPFIMSVFNIVMMPNMDGVAEWQSGVHTAPFTLKNFEPGMSAKPQAQPELLQEQQALSRRGRVHRHDRRGRSHERARDQRDRLH
jgi:hypothetical protein